MNRIFLYGIAGVEDGYRVVWYQYLTLEHASIRNITQTASWMKYKNQSIEEVYAIDESAALCGQYKRTIKANSVESNVTFKCMLERSGLKVI